MPNRDVMRVRRLFASVLLVFACFCVGFGLSACDDGPSSDAPPSQTSQVSSSGNNDASSKAIPAAASTSSDASSSKSDTPAASAASAGKSETTSSKKEASTKQAPSEKKNSNSYTAHEWSYEKYPFYYKVWGKAHVSEKLDCGDTDIQGRDSKERAGRVVSKVTYGMVQASAGWRESMDSDCDDISGWGHQAKVSVSLSNGRTYNGYAWNRSHLLADSLGGHADPDNLVTGTRTQNVGNNTQSNPGGMQYTETKALNYLRSHHKGWVYYSATPVFKGNELVCRSVYVDIKSDDGSIDEHVEVFNAMRGCTINYKTGEISGKSVSSAKKASSASSSYSSKWYGSSSSGSSANTSSHKASSKESGVTVYVTNSGSKYHVKGCRYLHSQHAMSLSKAKSLGYEPCKVCIG